MCVCVQRNAPLSRIPWLRHEEEILPSVSKDPEAPVRKRYRLVAVKTVQANSPENHAYAPAMSSVSVCKPVAPAPLALSRVIRAVPILILPLANSCRYIREKEGIRFPAWA
jgi:hypothetical protein